MKPTTCPKKPRAEDSGRGGLAALRVWPVKLWFSASLDSVGSKFPDDALAGGVSVSVLWMFPNKISLIFSHSSNFLQ